MPVLCVPIHDVHDLPAARDAGAEGCVVPPDLLGPARRFGLAPLAVRWPEPLAVAPSVSLPLEGARVVVTLPPPSEDDVRSFERVKSYRLACVRALRALAEWASACGGSVAVASGVETFFEGSLELCEAIRAARVEGLWWTLNSADAEACGEGVSGATDVGSDLLGHVIAEDWDGTPVRVSGRTALLPGRITPGLGGCVPFDRLFEQLAFLDYEGPVELAGAPDSWAAGLAALRRARGD